jgi:hypothetical protein
MKMRNSLAAAIMAAITAVVLAIAAPPAKAATINWSTAQNITGTASNDVVTTGSLFASANFYQTTGSGSGNVTVNGVQFAGFQSPTATPASGPTSLTVGNITLTGTSPLTDYVNVQGFTGAGGPASYNGLLNQLAFVYNTNTTGTMGVSVGGLTNGAQYLIQFWVNDSRGVAATRTSLVDGNTLAVNTTQTTGGFGQYITGTFTANSTTQSFQVTGGVGQVAYANAMQVRLLAVPEPETLAMAGVGVASAVMGRELRRRKKVTATKSGQA